MKALLLVAALSLPCFAGQLELEYSSFYGHLKKIDKEELNALQFSFGFKKAGESVLCHINSANIITQKVTLPVEINEFERFTLPTEKALNMAKGMVSLDITEPNNQCDMSVQLETKAEYLKTTYTVTELRMLAAQYTEFFDDMGGFLSFMMPSSKGIKMLFSEPLDGVAISTGLVIMGNELLLSDAWLAAQSSDISLSQKPLRITAMIEK